MYGRDVKYFDCAKFDAMDIKFLIKKWRSKWILFVLNKHSSDVQSNPVTRFWRGAQ